MEEDPVIWNIRMYDITVWVYVLCQKATMIDDDCDMKL